MNILFLTRRELANPLAGGSEVLVDRLARGLHEQGHDVTLVSSGPIGERPYRVRDGGGEYVQYLRAPFTFLHRYRDCDLVVDVANGMTFFSPLWSRRPVVCLVNHLHAEQWSQWFPWPMAATGRLLEFRAMPLAYRGRLFVAVSDSTAASLESIGVARDLIRVVPNGIDMRQPAASKSPEPLFLSLGRLVPHKRVELVLQAWDRVRPQVGGRLVIAGSGPERARLEAMAGDGVEFVGQVSEERKHELLGESWLLLQPAMFEGWGVVVMEAAVATTPTIAFHVPGLRDSVVHAQTGMLATSLDTFVDHWVSLARDPATRAGMGRRARERAARYGWPATVEMFSQVAEEAIARDPSPRRCPVPA